MNLPDIQGKLNQPGFFIYAAADSTYFDLYGRSLVNSVLANTTFGCHIHLYDPTPAQIDWCLARPRVSISWETISAGQFDSAIEFWSRPDLDEPYQSRRKKMLGLKQLETQTLTIWIKKTYYACMRFVRLSELVSQPMRYLAIDIDGIVRAPFMIQFPDDDQQDIYLYEKTKRDKKTGQEIKTGHLAGSILFTDKPQAMQFLHELADYVKNAITQDNIYWFLDQNAIDSVIVKYQRGLLPLSYIDWHMDAASSIWTAKGRRKELEVFQRELKHYQ